MADGLVSKKCAVFDDVIFAPGAEKDFDTGSYNPIHRWPELKTETRILPKGYRVSDEYRPTICDIKFVRDTPVKLRNGLRIYIDLYMPVDADKKYPVILAWTPYGKLDPPNNYGLYKDRALMKQKYSTGLDTFEGPEPDYWISNGYVVAVADSGGSTHSEGALWYYGNQEGLDVYDAVEWLGTQSWSNGKVGMVGNSWLAISQYFGAAHKPPHLTAIAPWEGVSDTYRDMICRGGIPSAEFLGALNKTLRLNESVEDIPSMLAKYPLMNDYWSKEKRVAFENIEIPAYIVASYCSFIHPYGTFRAYKKIRSKEKWLRVHNTQEWFDQQTPKYRDDLVRFYDYYLKGIDNGWPDTPKVRISLLDPTGQDVTDVPEADWPIPRTDYTKLYLDARDMRLSESPVGEEASVRYETKNRDERLVPFSRPTYTAEASDTGEGLVRFRIKFDKDTKLCGYFKMHLFVSTDAGDDMDLFAYVTKEDSMGWPYYPISLGVDYKGPQGRLRVSHRKIENDEYWDWRHEHKAEEPIAPNRIVEIETILWPVGMIWRSGESLVFTVSSAELQLFEFPTPPIKTRNKGTHTLYTGGKYNSYIEIPKI
ncbi:MAG: CocE/NonD family hydrolase [Clostridiales Family XIII bacterium]|jgi:predicted acyl esterase|nr:CocE/NonD family hydrolase [Clostridiales Family XIII bacterium]